MKFEEICSNEKLLDSIKKMGFSKPTEMQYKVIPEITKGNSVIVRARTATGKTLAYLIPILQSAVHGGNVSAIIVLPTRELALQVGDVAKKLSKNLDITTMVVYGGVSLKPQSDRIKKGVDIVIGTPGRIIDLLNRDVLKAWDIKFLVLDEADMMLSMGFKRDIEYIISNAQKGRQTLLFSATISEEIKELAKRYMENQEKVSRYEEAEIIGARIKHIYAVSSTSYKFSALLAYLHKTDIRKGIVFSNTKYNSLVIYKILKDYGYGAMLLHGGLQQKIRENAMRRFRSEKSGFLVTTDVASRGIDIVDVEGVINFDAPNDAITYVHRVGRSARIENDGVAFTIFNYGQTDKIREIEDFARIKLKEIRLDISEFKEMGFGRYVGRRQRR